MFKVIKSIVFRNCWVIKVYGVERHAKHTRLQRLQQNNTGDLIKWEVIKCQNELSKLKSGYTLAEVIIFTFLYSNVAVIIIIIFFIFKYMMTTCCHTSIAPVSRIYITIVYLRPFALSLGSYLLGSAWSQTSSIVLFYCVTPSVFNIHFKMIQLTYISQVQPLCWHRHRPRQVRRLFVCL